MITKPPVPAAAYYRASTAKQEKSVPEQREDVIAYADRNGYRIVAEYVDDGISGDDLRRRKDFQAMIRDAKKGDFRAVLCWDLSRFTREKPLHAMRHLADLDDAGVTLVTTDAGPIDTEDLGWLMFGLGSKSSNDENRRKSRTVLRDKIKAASRGEWRSRVPMGFVKDKATKKLKLGDPSKVLLVRRIFRDYLAGKSLRAIARALNAEGIPSPCGKVWDGRAIRDQLTNPAMCGRFVWNRERRGKYFGIKDGEIAQADDRYTSPTDWIVIEDNHPGIIDRKTFDRVQVRLKARRGITADSASGYVLTGLVRCGRCGEAMHGRGVKAPPGYNCSSNTRGKGCDGTRVRQDELLDVVLYTVVDQFRQPQNLDRLKTGVRRRIADQMKGVDVGDIRRRLASTDKKLAKAKQRLVEVDPDMLGVVQEQIRSLKAERDELAVSLERASVSANDRFAEAAQKIDKALVRLERLRGALQKTNPAKLRELLHCTIRHIEVETEVAPYGQRLRHTLAGGIIYLQDLFGLGGSRPPRPGSSPAAARS
jgi:site-specific DNA recombinase